MACPLSEAELLHDSKPITCQLHKIILTASHAPDLKSLITKSAKWDDKAFQLVDWDAHKRAISKYSRVQRISICKLAHGLYQTKSRDNKSYGTPETCSCCQKHDETLSHLFACASDPKQEEVFTKFIQNISKYTPEPSLEILQHGITAWEASVLHNAGEPKALFRRSINPAHFRLVQAFNDQTHIIG